MLWEEMGLSFFNKPPRTMLIVTVGVWRVDVWEARTELSGQGTGEPNGCVRTELSAFCTIKYSLQTGTFRASLHAFAVPPR